MSVSRRRFLQRGALAAAACATNPFSALASQHAIGGEPAPDLSAVLRASGSNWQDHAAALQGISRAMFSNAIGASFKVLSTPDAQPLWLTLLAVEDLPRTAVVNPASFAVASRSFAIAPASSGFVLRFGSSAQAPQGTYLFQHDNLGSFALFTVPESGGQTYNAIVNRLDAAVIIAVPVRAAAGSNASAAGITVAPATSSETGSLLHGPAGSPAVRRDVTRD